MHCGLVLSLSFVYSNKTVVHLNQEIVYMLFTLSSQRSLKLRTNMTTLLPFLPTCLWLCFTFYQVHQSGLLDAKHCQIRCDTCMLIVTCIRSILLHLLSQHNQHGNFCSTQCCYTLLYDCCLLQAWIAVYNKLLRAINRPWMETVL